MGKIQMVFTLLNKNVYKFVLVLSALSSPIAYAVETIDDRFEIIENGTQVRDLKTKLIWQRCSVGQKWDGASCKGKAKGFTFNDTNQLAADGWRMPEKEELLGLVDPHFNNPTINQKAFPNTPASDFWSSTVYPFTSNSWLVNFDYGLSSYGSASHPCFIRLVRNSD